MGVFVLIMVIPDNKTQRVKLIEVERVPQRQNFEWFLADHIVTNQQYVQRPTVDYYKEQYRTFAHVALPTFFDHEEHYIVEDGHHRLLAQKELQQREGYIVTDYGLLPSDHKLILNGAATPVYIPDETVYMVDFCEEFTRNLSQPVYHKLDELIVEDPQVVIDRRKVFM
ncbi:hypothetical protein GF389_00775 [Candidatus Dojkabacteria bacterium]|nr:hypothetical protein [Candidatus Dojkabacteria bacterium]